MVLPSGNKTVLGGGTHFIIDIHFIIRGPQALKNGVKYFFSPKKYNFHAIEGKQQKMFMLLSQQFTYFICKDHQAIVCFATDGPTHTLSRVAHRIKRQEVIFPDLKLISEVFQPRLIQANRSGFLLVQECIRNRDLGALQTLRIRLWV